MKIKLVLFVLVSLLSGARNEKNNHLAEKIFHRMKKLFPQSSGPLTSAAILLANIYASSGDLDKASDIRIQLHRTGAKKKVGLSWTVVNGKIFVNINFIDLLNIFIPKNFLSNFELMINLIPNHRKFML
jgi:hypothetical protein